ncbi:major facilitator superfamily domain-containing protein 6-like [Orbicella faveolata]|uniref:major facilitator superfamily domain-containing protein 6-like n=1 Tax=Orbicella faveolata TaxID=48498 RepID=UPI0009E4DE72|nr:major facilitator superfamily domain-containing protein 6-like [Orbicella faveolata]
MDTVSGKGWKSHWSFDRTKFIFQAFYFFFLSAFVTRLVYLPIYLKQLGLNANYVGILSGVIPLARGAGAPIIGYVADETNSRKLAFLVSLVSQTLAPILLLIPRPSEPECQSRVAMETPKHPYNKTWMEKSLNKTSDQEDIGQSQELLQIFLILLVLFIITEFIAAPTKSLADSSLLENLDSTESTNYGRFRMWGNVGQIILYLMVSPVAKSNTVRVCGVIQDDYGLTMFPFSIVLLFAFILGLMIDFKQDELRATDSRRTKREIQESSLKDVLLNLHNIAFIVIILYLGIVDGIFSNFMFWYLTDIDPSQATWVIGVAGISRNIAGAFSFGSSGIVIRKLGVLNTVNLSLAFYVAGFVIYGLLTNPWLAIIPEVMQFFAYGVSMPACIVYFKERTSEEYSATTQGIVFSCYLGVGFGLGSMIGGFLVDIIGGSWTFLLSGGVTAIVLVLCVLSLAITKLLNRMKNNKVERETEDYESS